MHRILWTNGHLDQALTWQGLLDIVRTTQWRDLDEYEFRAEMAKRAFRWSGVEIDAGAPPRRFFHELARAGLVLIEGSK